MINIGCINGKQPHVGEIVFFRVYDGTCDNCGAGHEEWADFPALYLGVYQDERGSEYEAFEAAVWLRCKGCGGFCHTIKVYKGIPAEKYGLFEKVKMEK